MEDSEIETLDRIQYDIIIEISKALTSLGACPDLLGIIGSWGDTLTQKQILSLLKRYNQSTEVDDCFCHLNKQQTAE